MRAGHFDDGQRRRLHCRIDRLTDGALAATSQVEDQLAARRGLDRDRLVRALQDVELATEHLGFVGERTAASADELPASTRRALVAALDELHEMLQPAGLGALTRPVDAHPVAPARVPTGDGAGLLVHPLLSAVQEAAAAMARVWQLADDTTAAAARRAAAPPDEAGHEPRHGVTQDEDQALPDPVDGSRSPARRLRPTTVLALQVGLAASAAMAAGQALSSSRWHWAVITALTMFVGTKSRGDALSNGWQTLAGTVVGVVAGVLLAAALAGDPVQSAVLALVAFFFFVYAGSDPLPAAACMTVVLALLFGLVGQFTFGLLLIRLAETAVGAGIGAAVAVFVLPTRTGPVVRTAAHDVLAALGEIVQTAARRLLAEPGVPSAAEPAQRLHEQVQALRQRARPLTEGIAGLGTRSDVDHAIRALTACDHHARALARAAARAGPPDPELAALFEASTQHVQARIRAVDRLLDRQPMPPPVRSDVAAALRTGEGRTGQSPDAANALRSLAELDRALATLARLVRPGAGSAPR